MCLRRTRRQLAPWQSPSNVSRQDRPRAPGIAKPDWRSVDRLVPARDDRKALRHCAMLGRHPVELCSNAEATFSKNIIGDRRILQLTPGTSRVPWRSDKSARPYRRDIEAQSCSQPLLPRDTDSPESSCVPNWRVSAPAVAIRRLAACRAFLAS